MGAKVAGPKRSRNLDAMVRTSYSQSMASVFRHLGGHLLNMDFRELGKLYLFFRRYPVLARKATAQLLNDLGFAWRPLAVTTLASRLIMRNPRFILSRMRVQKTAAGPIERQAVTIGSTIVRGKGGNITFDGFYSLQTGRDPQRNRTLGLLARGGDKRAQARRQGKLNPADDIPKPQDWDDIPQPSSARRAQAMIRAVADTTAYGKRLLLSKGDSAGMAPGLYRIKRRRGYLLPSTGRSAPQLAIVQHFGRRPRGQRWQWMQASLKWLLGHAPIASMWQRAIGRVTQQAISQSKVL